MSKITHHLTVALGAFVFGVAITVVVLINHSSVENRPENANTIPIQEAQGLSLLIPDASWEPLFFQRVNEHTKEANLPRLRTVLLPYDDIELRIWVGFGINGEDGLILRRSSGQWSAIHLHGMSERPPFIQSQKAVAMPKSGWETAWTKLVNAGILTLPDASAV